MLTESLLIDSNQPYFIEKNENTFNWQTGISQTTSRGKELEYRVIAVNKAGDGPQSNTVEVVL